MGLLVCPHSRAMSAIASAVVRFTKLRFLILLPIIIALIRKLLLYEEVAELFAVLLRREFFRLTQGWMDLLREFRRKQNTSL